jgi:dipeptidyl aminopeptidase/acylaminoacyl peptidase
VKKVGLIVVLLVCALPASAAKLPTLASHDWWPVYSPDSRAIAFTRVNGQGRVFTLEVVSPGGRVDRLAQASSQLMPSWSPDATHLAYQSGGRIYTVARDGSGRRSVVAGLFPDWSPDGVSIAYVRAGALRVASKVLATHVISKPVWSPDGDEIAFARSDGIHVVTLAGAERYVAPTVGEPTSPVWSFDGSRLAYAVGTRVFLVAADGAGKPRRVAGPYRSLGPIAWAPAGDLLAFTADGKLIGAWLTSTPHTSVLAKGAGVGASFAPGDPQGRILAYSAQRKSCPGHSGIRLYESSMLSGTCTVAGTAAADVIEGTGTFGDVILAGAGNDKVHANDRHTDRVDCGPGRDEVWADKLDRLARCEIVHR